jgi:flavodoxin
VPNIITLYASIHGHTKKVAECLPNPIEVRNAAEISGFDLFVFVCPTYGDEELPLLMEDFLLNIKSSPKDFVVCELGNLFGYEDFRFGPRKIISRFLKDRGWNEVFHGLSLDSLPRINWPIFENWKRDFETWIETL